MKYLHLVSGGSRGFIHRVGSLIRGFSHGSNLLDYTNLGCTGGSVEYLNSSRLQATALAECLSKFSQENCLVILLQDAARFHRLLFSEILEFPFELKCICWNIRSERPTCDVGASAYEGYDAFVEIEGAAEADELSVSVENISLESR